MTDRIRSRPLHFVSCTKGSKDDTLLHPSLSKLGIDSCTFFEFDTVGLSKRYNEVLDAWRGRDEIVVFARDDVSVCDVFVPGGLPEMQAH